MPDGPFESWSLADRAQWLADEMLAVGDEDIVPAWVVKGWGSTLIEMAGQLVTAMTVPTAARLCGLRSRGRGAACDRPAGHGGTEHSWSGDHWRRIAAEYEEMTVEVPRLRRAVSAGETTIRRLRREVAAWEAKPRFRRKPKEDRG